MNHPVPSFLRQIRLALLPALSLWLFATPSQATLAFEPVQGFVRSPERPHSKLIQASDGNLYGATREGGSSGRGTVFRMTPNGTLTTLANFSQANGYSPQGGLVQGSDGNFYGTTNQGGSDDYGTVFRMTLTGTLTTLVQFASTNGSYPLGSLVQGSDGNFYGTTEGAWNYPGTAFKMTSAGTLTTLVNFTGANGSYPKAGLVQGSDGNFYGTTSSGGSSDVGTVFSMTATGTLTTLMHFTSTNGLGPRDLVQGNDGNFYGTTQLGGSNNKGTVFSMTPSGTLTTLVDFTGTNGSNPSAGLVQGSDGNFYGTTYPGGSSNKGTVFRMSASGTLTTLVNFTGTGGSALGSRPYGRLVQGSDGNFYGTTYDGGGSLYYGTVFKMTPAGTLTTLVNFTGTDGSNPSAGLVRGSDGNFYGTTTQGGSSFTGYGTGHGTVFRMTPTGERTTLVNFTGTNGRSPDGGLVQGSDGNFYGTTQFGGSSDLGTVFKMTPAGSLTTLVNFTGANGSRPQAGLVQGGDGNFYGTTSYGGNPGSGTVFRMTPTGTITTLVNFTETIGGYPVGALVQASDGNFYGTTVSGGTTSDGLPAGGGQIFRLTSSEIPEIAVEQPPNSSLADGGSRDFGSVTLGENSSLTFTIMNTGSGDLTLTGTPKVAVTGSSDFTVTTQPTSPITGPNGSTNFTVRFSPTTVGLKNATIHIASNDADENPYDINLTGATTAPAITIQPLGSSIYEGETANLSVSASGANPLVYQWYAGPSGNTANPVGVNSATLTTGNLFATTSFWVRVSNSFGSADSATATITLLPSKPTITSVSAASGRQSTLFSHQITATQNPTSYGAVGLPSGLSLNASTGLISGFPVVSGTFAVTLSAQNGVGTGQQVLNLQIYPPFTSVITSPLFAAATATVPFSSQLTATDPWISFEIQNGPAWLSVNPNTGLLSGTPIVPGTVTVQVRATSSGQSDWSTLSISISPHPNAPVITSLAEVSGRMLESLIFQITASPAATSYEVAGALPSGIVLNTSSGLLAGLPTVEGIFPVTITASNASGLSIATPLTIVLWPARLVPVITSETSFVVNIGTSFSTTVLATNSPSVFTFENLPPGLLQTGTSGQISGPLTTAGTFAFTVRASNGDGSGPTQNMVLRVRYNAAAPAVIALSGTMGYVGLPLSSNIAVSMPATLFTAVGLPPGLTLNPATGEISGTPAANGSFDVTLQASNAAGMGEPRVLTIRIEPTPDAPEIIGSLLEETTALSSFSYAIQTNSVLPITSYTVSGLPDGITANSISGLISGAANLTGVFDVKMKAANAVGASAEKVMRLTVRAGSLVPKITSSASEAVQQGASFSYQITASNPPILAWQTSTLPTGLALNSTTGAITGKPLVPGIYQVALRASNVNGAGDIQMLQIQVKPNAAVPVMLVPIKVWFDGANPINMQLEATNLPTSKPWESGIGIFATNLPSGMTLNSATGVLSGHSPSSFSGISIGFYGVNSTGRGPNKVITFRDYDNKANQPVITGPFQLSATRGMNLSFTTTVDRPASSFDVIWSGPNGSGQMSGASPNFLIPASNLPLPGISIYSLGAYNGAFGDRGGLSMSVASASGAPTIQSPSEIYCTAGAPISASLAASGTPTRFEISAMSPAWPSGLSFNNNTGTFSGTVSQTGVISFLARAYNAVGASLTKEITMVFSPPAGAPTITTGEALASVSSLETEEMEPMSDPLSPLYGQVGVAFIHQFQATGNVIRFGITGLPEGLVYNENTGEVSGEPVEPGHFDLIVTPIGSTISGQPVTFALWIEAAAGTPEITSPAAAAAVAGTAFTWQFTASATPVGYNLAELPDWLNFDPFTGSLSGIPSVPGDTKLQISGFNALGEGLTQEFTIYATAAAGTPVVNPPAGSFPGQVGVAFNASISAAGTVNFYDASALPFGISLNAQTGVFSGIPVESGTHVVQVWGVNAQGIGESRAVTFTISPAVGTPAFNGDTNLRAIAGQAFAHAFTTVPAATAFAANGLPSGWSFDPVSGLLQAATPLAGDFNLEIEAWNAAGSSGNQLFQVRVFADAKELWQDEKFGDQADNPAVGGWTADPDRDSVSNLLEYAFGLNPNSGASLQFPPAQRVGGNFIISFIQPAGVTGITYGAEWSPTMNVGTWLPVPDTGSGGVHTFSVPIGSHTKMFIRLTVTN